jgi:MFS family permease
MSNNFIPKAEFDYCLNKNHKQAVGLLSIGTFLEYFDLMLYVHMAVLLNELFFPKTDPHSAQLLGAIAFCSIYVLRPFGALIFGYIGDKIGRKSTVVMTTLFMAISCLIMALLPTYAQIGIAAAWIATICRIVQGMTSMGEITGAQLFLSETIKPPARYPAIAILAFSVSIGTFAALGVASLVTSFGFNWRYAFVIGAGIAVVGAVARTTLRETPEFIDAKRRANHNIRAISSIIDSPTPDTNSLMFLDEKTHGKTTLTVFLMDCMWPLCFYFTYVHCANILKNNFGYSSAEIIHQNFAVSMVQLMNTFLVVLFSYKFHPLSILKVKLAALAVCMILCPYWLNNATSGNSIFILQSVMIFFACDAAPATSVFYKYFPVFKRFTYIGFLYALSRAITYIITSFGFVYLVDYFGNYGVLIIMIPIILWFANGINYFENLEKKA